MLEVTVVVEGDDDLFLRLADTKNPGRERHVGERKNLVGVMCPLHDSSAAR